MFAQLCVLMFAFLGDWLLVRIHVMLRRGRMAGDAGGI